ncbi:hypothetical protein HETIRDRAFT_429990 [Heterobasidion irregulare TC 32-1]|uniref:Uncharacterized protein n=1 Tax=Heterobasidion irregulare (strain TC 32-1) TaxID=747525 RepID=W4JSQ1_HETIT|nr:uncharacterized protein HETIRDRAFT_429990 [Heterobasidion irregulare TC 32-1]ETW76592.1 hypothetical protein HETIRDRAFT_429990 [Heterobasidion irregulare TC 32-1]
MATPSMPTHRDRMAPTFDPHQPCKLRRYFADLDFHFGQSAIEDDQEKKKHACRFLDVDTCELWELLTTFTDAPKTFKEFYKEVYRLYPGSEEERKWSVSDMDKLVGKTSRVGILSLSELGNYHRKAQILVAKQGHAFTRGFQLELWARILQCLQLKFPDHFPDNPYNLQDIHNAARFILHGTTSAYSMTSTDISRAAPAALPTNAIKAEDLATMPSQLKGCPGQPINHPDNQDKAATTACSVAVLNTLCAPVLRTFGTFSFTGSQTTMPAKDDAPIHPYTKAQDAAYALPHKCNMGAPAKIPLAKKDALAYKTMVPIYDEKVAAEVYNRTMATQVTLTQCKLLSLSAKVRSQVREATLARRSPARDASNVWTFYQDANLPYAIDDLEPPARLTVSSFVNVLHQLETPPPGATIIPNMYETYLKNLQPDQVPQPLIVAKESSALRSIVPLVDHQQEVECIIDPVMSAPPL